VVFEARLEDALRRRDDQRNQVTSSSPIALSWTAADMEELIQLTGDLHTLWNSPTTTNEVVSRLMGKMLGRAFRCAGDVAA
jgi:hypothetical protein